MELINPFGIHKVFPIIGVPDKLLETEYNLHTNAAKFGYKNIKLSEPKITRKKNKTKKPGKTYGKTKKRS